MRIARATRPPSSCNFSAGMWCSFSVAEALATWVGVRVTDDVGPGTELLVARKAMRGIWAQRTDLLALEDLGT